MGYRDKLVHDPGSGKIVADAAFNLNATSIGEVVSDLFSIWSCPVLAMKF
jgi:hypothetical protein